MLALTKVLAVSPPLTATTQVCPVRVQLVAALPVSRALMVRRVQRVRRVRRVPQLKEQPARPA